MSEIFTGMAGKFVE